MSRPRASGLTRLALLTAAIVVVPAATFAQGVDGYASVMFDVLPRVERAGMLPGGADGVEKTVSELRTRLLAERRFDFGSRFRLSLGGFVEGLVAARGASDPVAAAIVRPQELHAEVLWSKADLRVGLSRVVWGKLDEFLPTDVINPLDFSRFFLEGRSEARLPVAMVRGRLFPSEQFTLDAVYVPFFRRGRFDQLDESTSPFNLEPPGASVIHEPRDSWENAQGGVRASVTTGRVDWSISGYRGFEAMPIYEISPAPPATLFPWVEGRFPRYTMIGGDIETVRGQWGVRGEVAAFVERTLQATNQPVAAAGSAIEAGMGVDRRAGDYRLSGSLIVSRERSQALDLDDLDTLIVASIDRSFLRETRQLRAFAVYNPADDSAFARLITSFELRDDVTLEASGGWFVGNGTDALSRLATRDFLYTRLKVSF